MSWVIVFDKKAQKELTKLDREVQRRIIFELDNISILDNPRLLGKALTGSLAGLWRYRIGNYRVVCQIHDGKLQVLVIKIAHRKEVYK
jgi:mRNA interferase RelE/StbE